MIPILANRRGFGFENFSDCRILDVDSLKPDRFFSDNFGLISTSYHNVSFGQDYPELFKSLTLISEQALKSRYHSTSQNREYITDPAQVMEQIASRGKTLTLSMLADYLAPYLDFRSFRQESFNLVIGETPADRVLFWKFHHNYTDLFPTDIAGLCISPQMMEMSHFLDVVRRIVEHRWHATPLTSCHREGEKVLMRQGFDAVMRVPSDSMCRAVA